MIDKQIIKTYDEQNTTSSKSSSLLFAETNFFLLCLRNSNRLISHRFTEMTEICFSTLITFVMVKCGKIWFPWQNLVNLVWFVVA